MEFSSNLFTDFSPIRQDGIKPRHLFFRSGTGFIVPVIFLILIVSFSDAVGDYKLFAPDSSIDSNSTVPLQATEPIRHPPESLLDSTSVAADTAAAAVDSQRILFIKDSLSTLEHNRRVRFYPQTPSHPHNENIPVNELFRSDASTLSDLEQLRLRYIAPKTGIANYFNRLLFYGNTVPLSTVYNDTRFIESSLTDPVYGYDLQFPLNFNQLKTDPYGVLYSTPHHTGIVVPEMAMSWETGVFDENILSVRFSRPIAKKLFINVFSNYRAFDKTNYSHSSNDINDFYRSLYKNDSLSAHKGYNPLVREYFCGANILWEGKLHSTDINVSYGDLSDEIATNSVNASSEMNYAKLNQFPFRLTTGIFSHLQSRFFYGIEGQYNANVERWHRPSEQNSQVFENTRISSQNLHGVASAGYSILDRNDSLTLIVPVSRLTTKSGDSLDNRGYTCRPVLRYSLPVKMRDMHGTLSAGGGYDFYTDGSNYDDGPLLNTGMHLEYASFTLDGYFEHDKIHYLSPVDSLKNGIYTFREPYTRTGLEVSQAWKKVSIVLGWQWCTAFDTVAMHLPWISGKAPYIQPQSVFLIAPTFGRWKGIQFSSRCMLSDTKPYVKLNSILSFYIFPNLLYEAFDIRIGFNYWSKRNPVEYAEQNKWHYSVFDLNVASAVHIKSFRLTYKIDNLLNRKFSYIPGYYSPGLTFRWGFSWFIQR